MKHCPHINLKIETIVPGATIGSTDGKIYWHIANFTPDMDKYKVILSIQKAFNHWQRHFNEVFTTTSNPVEAHIVFQFKNNGEQGLPEQFGQYTLAYAFAPVNGRSAVFLNDKWNWSELHEPGSYNLFKVLVHELGHSFNLGHSEDIVDIMYPTYQPDDSVVITSDTISTIQRLYGAVIDYTGLFKELFYSQTRYRVATKRQLSVIFKYLRLDNGKTTKKKMIDRLIEALKN